MESKCGRAAARGLAPFASVEDLSDEHEQESPEEKHRLTLPGVKEEGLGSGPKSPKMGVPTPRIDISRASSSSHQDDSSPERDLFTGGAEGGPVVKLGLGFTEEMAQELRNSTEELDFQDPTDIETKQRRRKLHQQQAVIKYELEMQGDREGKERKDSACSDTGLLYISGRTSRLSSIGSAASGGSAASHLSGASHFSGASHLSAASHLSGASHLSRASRCSSPHKMLLETSFCGPKPIPTVSLEAEYPPKESVEVTLLARNTDPTGAVLPVEEHKNMVNGKTNQSHEKLKATKSSSSTLTVGRESSIKSKSSDRVSKSPSNRDSRSSSIHSRVSQSSEAVNVKVELEPAKSEVEKTTPTHRKEPPRIPPGTDAKFISLHDDEEEPVTVTKTKTKSLALESDQRIISLHSDDPPLVKETKKSRTPLEGDSRIISLHSDEPVQPRPQSASVSKRKPTKESSSKNVPVKKVESKSAPVSSSARRKQPPKYEGDRIFIPLTGDETPIVLSEGNKPTTALEGDCRIIPLHGSPEEPVKEVVVVERNIPLDKDSRIIPLKGDIGEIELHTQTRKSKPSEPPQQRIAPVRKKPTIAPDASAVIIPLHGDEEIVALEIETDRPSSPEYGIYIPLKGPELADYSKKAQAEMRAKPKPEVTAKSPNVSKPTKLDVKSRSKPSKTSPSVESKPLRRKDDDELVKFVSLHGDESERKPLKIEVTEEFHEERYDLKANEFRSKSASPVSHAGIQSIQHTYFKPDNSSAYSRKHSTGSCRSPELEGAKVKPATLDLTQIVRPSRPVQSLTQLTRDESRTPSPATSMSRGSLFRRSSESSSSTKSRGSVSSDLRARKDSKNKSVFTSLFKKGSRDSVRRKSESSEKTTPMDPRLTKVEFRFNQQDSGQEDSIIIPLHSPESAGGEKKVPQVPAPQVDVHIHPPDLTAETVQSISEVVAAIEELKSQPLISPVPTPTFSTFRKQEPVKETVKPEPKIEIVEVNNQFTNINFELECEKDPETKSAISVEIESQEIEIKSDLSSLVETQVESQTKIELDISPKREIELSPKSENSAESFRAHLETPFEKQESDKKSDTETLKTGSEERRSSESEPDSDAVALPSVADDGDEDDHERKGLFLQQESMDDELPYVPTTLPQERSVAHPIIPVKQRGPEAVKTCPIDRPRSTTPIYPTTLDDFVSSPHEEFSVSSPREKMQIVLPRKESLRENRPKSPHRSAAKPWTHFAEQGLQSPREARRVSSSSPPPPLPPRSTPAPAPAPGPSPASWVCFDEVPERRRTPKRITTLPSSQPPVYSYVNPEECSCECHESQTRVNGADSHCQAKDSYRT